MSFNAATNRSQPYPQRTLVPRPRPASRPRGTRGLCEITELSAPHLLVILNRDFCESYQPNQLALKSRPTSPDKRYGRRLGHKGRPAHPTRAWTDETGALWLLINFDDGSAEAEAVQYPSAVDVRRLPEAIQTPCRRSARQR